jgi:hypothetical protein
MHSMHFRSKKEAGIKIVPHWSWIAQDGVSGCVATESGHLCCSFGRSPTGSSHSKSHLVSPELDSTIEVCIPSFNNATAISWWHPECDCARMRRWKHRRSTNEAPTIHAIPRSRMLSLAVVCYLSQSYAIPRSRMLSLAVVCYLSQSYAIPRSRMLSRTWAIGLAFVREGRGAPNAPPPAQ